MARRSVGRLSLLADTGQKNAEADKQMIEPSKINSVAKRYAKQNSKFRTFLKSRADADELDAQFLYLHNELFADYDCCKCNNCCKTYYVILENDEIANISRYLGKAENDFINEYLTESDEGGYKIKGESCLFLCGDGKCEIQECKPSECKGFPFTDRPDRLSSMFGILGFAEECPVVFEILERLKRIYRFRN